jgi:uncharacterized protein (TIGR03435 family)
VNRNDWRYDQHALRRAKRVLRTTVGFAALTGPVVIALGNVPAIRAQSSASAKAQTAPVASANAATPKFEVASIKPCKADEVGRRNGGGGGSSTDRLTLNCRTVMDFVEAAYAPRTPLSSVPIDGGPAWINSDGYTIEAKADGTPGQATMMGPMLQALLEDRFKLKIHRENREVPVYALTVANGGPKLQSSSPGSCVPVDYSLPTPHPQFCGTPKRGDPGFHLIGATMADLCWVLSAPEISDRKTVDKTGIAGMFDIQLPGPGELNRAAHNGEVSESPDFFEALHEAVQMLGLNLERARGTGEFLVIDHIERPSEN